jgi:hypothetical protein
MTTLTVPGPGHTKAVEPARLTCARKTEPG